MRQHRLTTLLALLLLAPLAAAQTYVGTMQVNDYTRKDVEVRLGASPQGQTVLQMLNVKFARMMPVKVDVDIPGVSLGNGRLAGDNIVPTSKGKPYEKYLVTRLDGSADSEKITFRCLMGDKQIKFSGRRAKKNNAKNQ